MSMLEAVLFEGTSLYAIVFSLIGLILRFIFDKTVSVSLGGVRVGMGALNIFQEMACLCFICLHIKFQS